MTTKDRHSAPRTMAVCVLLAAQASSLTIALPAFAAGKGKPAPTGTMMIPMTPQLDNQQNHIPASHPASAPVRLGLDTTKSAPAPSATPAAPAPAKQQIAAAPPKAALSAPANNKNPKPAPAAPGKLKLIPLTPAAAAPLPAMLPEQTPSQKLARPELPVPPHLREEAEISKDDGTSELDITDNTLLKGTVSIVADDTEYDQNRNTFLGTGNAVATIAGQDSRLEADMILYDQNSQTLDARGNVKILRDGQLSTGSSFKFKVNSDEYLITDPDTEVQGTEVIARSGYGTKKGIAFKNGTMSLPKPIYIARNPFFGTLQSGEDTGHKTLHPDAYLPAKPSFRFKARKMTYEKYKEQGNLTVHGGRLMFGQFGVPVGKLTATVGEESRVTMPVSPFISNNLQVGGLNVGPQFNQAVGKYGVFSWAPLVQIGGGDNTSGVKQSGVGAGARISYTGKRLSGNLAYGSVSNLLVGDVRYQFNQRQMLQGGINRFLPDGLFGPRRARAIMEVVDQRGVGGVPFLTGISFRTSAGWMQDQPSLVNMTPDYAKLFTITNGNITSGYRIQEQIMTQTEPIFSVGDKKWGAQMNIFGGVAAKAYSTGDSMLMGQIGPVLNLNLNRAKLQGTLFKSGVNGQSPFVFDQFIQGSKAAQIAGDVKICKWLTVGTNLGYNLDAKLLYQRSISAAIGPDDFKLLLTRDTIRGTNRFGFDVLYGNPIKFDKLVLKGSPDRGQLGNGI